ncbi:hypothetical protein KIW84_072731 [Lathyrus oleraceus]|uniref:HAT C-terminal dimerisation domain-containing protein n=1 Tax=Pisum sativum TaxID=3888 RepID=A0A9D4ZVK0_PEA|nr:hypothetical protein KIW84_072731 [Pisum sativum]
MFKSMEWKSSQFAKTSVEDVVFDHEFWKNVLICLKGENPLIEVLSLVNSMDEPATGFIYEAMEQAKVEIRRNLSIERDHNIIRRGLHHCITRMTGSTEERAKIEIQLDDFDKRADLLGDLAAIMTAGYEILSVWWADFGGGLPELQSIALRVLSLTCNSYGAESNQSAFKMVYPKRQESDDGEDASLDADDMEYDMISDLHGEYANGDEDQIKAYWC